MKLGLKLGLETYNSNTLSANELLDQFPGAIAGFAFMPLLSGDSDPVVTVRRSSDDSEQSFTLDECTDGTLTAWVGAGDGFVKTWNEPINGIDASQTTNANQPKIVNSGSLVQVNGVPYLLFSGNQFMQATYGSLISQPASIFFVCDYDSASTFLGFDGIDSTNRMAFSNGDSKWTIFAGTSIRNTAEDINPHLFSILFNGASSYLYVDGVESITSNAGSNSSAGVTLGAGYDGVIAPLVGKIGLFIIYNSDQSANRVAIETAINSYYSIY